MEINKLHSVFLFILTAMVFSCSRMPHQSLDDQSIARFPAQVPPYQQCIYDKKRLCQGTFPYQTLQKKWWQFEFQYLDQKNELHKKYNQCYTKGSIQCAKKFELYELSTKLEKLKSSKDIAESIADLKDVSIWNDVTIPMIQLAQNAVKEIWIHILAFKKIYEEIVAKAKIKDKAYKFLHGKGVSISGLAYAGAGVGINHEAIIHNGELALFCAPGVLVKSDVGIGLDFSAIQTLGCKDHADYRGKFFTLDFGGSAEMFGLPLSAGISYSLGIDVSNFLKTLADKAETGEFSVKNVLLELMDIYHTPENLDPHNRYSEIYLGYLMSKTFGDKELSLRYNEKLEYSNKEFNLFSSKRALSYYLKRYLNKVMSDHPDYVQSKPNFFFALSELNNNLSECDAVSGSVGLSLSLLPVSAGLSLHQYTQVTQIKIDDILYLSSFTPKMLMTLNLPPGEFERFKATLRRVMQVIPDIAFNKCLENAGRKFYRDGMNVIRILQGQQ